MNPRFTYDELHWYISVGIEVEDSTTIPLNNGIGIDLGIKDLAVCSDGNIYKNINKTTTVNKLEKENVGYSVPYQEDMRKIRKEEFTVKHVTL